MRQQLLCAERVDYTSWTNLCPAVLLFAVTPCLAVFGCDVDCAFSVLHVARPLLFNFLTLLATVTVESMGAIYINLSLKANTKNCLVRQRKRGGLSFDTTISIVVWRFRKSNHNPSIEFMQL